MSHGLGAFAGVLAGDPGAALALWRAERGDLRLAFDRDPPFHGARRAAPPLPWSSLEGRLRSWEMLDRVTEPAELALAEEAAREALQILACPNVLRGALLVRVADARRATLLGHLAASRWAMLGAPWATLPGLGLHEERVRRLRAALEGP